MAKEKRQQLPVIHLSAAWINVTIKKGVTQSQLRATQMKQLIIIYLFTCTAAVGVAQKLVLPESFYTGCEEYPVKLSDALLGIPKAAFGPYRVVSAERLKEGEKVKDSHNDLFQKTTDLKTQKRIILGITCADTNHATAECITRDITSYTGTNALGTMVGIKDKNNTTAIASYPMAIEIYSANDTLTWKPGVEQYYLSGTVVYKTDSFITKSLYTIQKRSGKTRSTVYCQGIYVALQEKIIAALQFEPQPRVWMDKGLTDDSKRMIGFYLATMLSMRQPDQ